MKMLRNTHLVLLVTLTFAAVAFAQRAAVDYPTDFRSWHHVKTGIIQPGHGLAEKFGGIHHIYANPAAMKGLNGGTYEIGAVLVFDLLEYVESDLTITEAARRRIDVMQYDPDKFGDTDGWGYDSFLKGSKTDRVEQDAVVACYACHTSVAESNFVFSKYRE